MQNIKKTPFLNLNSYIMDAINNPKTSELMKGMYYKKMPIRLIEVIIQYLLQIHKHQLIYCPKLV